MATRIDTLRTYESIHDAGVEAAAARAITAAIETALSASQEQLATKSDLQMVKNDVQMLRTEMLGEFGKIRSEMQGGFNALRSDFEKSVADAQLKTVLWLGGVMLGLAGVVLAAVKLL